jgi:Coenzyme PQQ synthesis protein D (PqqD)
LKLKRLFGRDKTPAPEIDILGLVPIRNVEHRPDETTGCAILLDPRFKSGPLGRWLQPRLNPERAHILVRLDEMGSFVWDQIDGRRTIDTIIRTFVDVYPEQRDDAAERVWKFLQVSKGHGLISWLN